MPESMMPNMIWVVIVVVVVLQLSSRVCACPPDCDCRPMVEGLAVVCRGRSNIPLDIPNNTIELDMSHNQISELTRASFPQLTRLRKLVLEDGKITTVGALTFTNMEQLTNLSLSNNRIRNIDKAAFQNLSELRHLSLDNNLIQHLPAMVFKDLALLELNLNGNQLQELNNNVFTSSEINTLYLNGNSFSEISRDLFLPLQKSLTILNISNNAKPLRIEKGVFRGFRFDNLTLESSQIMEHEFLADVQSDTLDISGNPLYNLDFSAYGSLNSVTTFHARSIGIEFLEHDTFVNLRSVTSLDLSSNKIVMISATVFRNTPHLVNLILDHNPFIMLPDNLGQNLEKLETLQLIGCHLMTLSRSSFVPMVNLTRLDLRYNKLQVIPDNMRDIFERLGPQLQVQHNPFHCNCEILWFYNWLKKHEYPPGADICHSPNKTVMTKLKPSDFACTIPKIIRIKNITTEENKDVFFTCSAQADPAPEVAWIDSSDEIFRITPPSNRTNLKTSNTMRIKANDVTLSSSGARFVCRATNLMGSVSGTMILTVVPKGTLYTTTEPTNTLNLTWTYHAPYVTEQFVNITDGRGIISTLIISPTPSSMGVEMRSSTTAQTGKHGDNEKAGVSATLIIILVLLACIAIAVLLICFIGMILRSKNRRKKYNIADGCELNPKHQPINVIEEKLFLTQV